MVCLSVNPSNSFQRQSVGNEVSSVSSCRIVLDLEITVSSYLIWLVNGLDNNSDTTFIIWIFSIITVQVTDSLLGSVFLLNPIFYKILNLTNVHELNIIDMSVLLPLDDNVWWNTFVTHGLWVGFMVLAFCVHLISNLRRWKAVVTFNVTWMNSFTLKLLLFKKMIERNVSHVWNKLLV